jgi:autotransporter family porin
VHGRILRTTIIALVASLTLAPIANAGPTRVRAEKTRAAVAVFKLPRALDPDAVRAARVRVGRRARRISAARVRRVARRTHKLCVRLNRRERYASSNRRPRLLIFRKHRSEFRGVEPEADADTPVSDIPQDVVSTDEQIPDGPKSIFRPPFSPVLSDAEAAARVRPSGPEARPGNTKRNSTVPTAQQLEHFRQTNETLYEPHKQLVTGNFRGTTDEIIQWAAWKWGIDEDVFRAQAVQETWWDTNVAGDGGESFGLFQIKRTVHFGTYPLSVDSTAFNADYTGALFRWYYDGHATWVMDVEHGKDYVPGDAWGAIGAHFAGRWYAGGAQDYIEKVRAHEADRTWEQPYF